MQDMTPSLEESLIGQILDNNFEIQEIIGEGGFAWVYRAFDRQRQYPIAIKILKNVLSDEEEKYSQHS